MARRECFGSLKEVIVKQGYTMTQSRPECRTCDEFRDCLRQGKDTLEEKQAVERANEKDELNELKKQNMIAQIIDLSQMISNEIGSCLLDFLNRIYNSPLNMILFKNLLLFHEIPRGTNSSALTIPISPSTFNLVQGGEAAREQTARETIRNGAEGPGEVFFVHLVMIQKSFPKNQKANIGLIAYEVAHVFSSDDRGMSQILEVLADSEKDLFKKMDAQQRKDWLMEKWGFLDELNALKKAMTLSNSKNQIPRTK